MGSTSMDSERLSDLFALYLFRIRNWSKGYSARYFTKKEVDDFKGISLNTKEDFPFVRLNRIVHHYIENYNNSYHRGIDKNSIDYPFQLDQTIINGKRFFEMIAHYDRLINEIENRKDPEDCNVLSTIKTYEKRFRTGDKYVRNLFYCGLIYYIDKFGEAELSKAIKKIFIWAYSLRLQLARIGVSSVDNYAINQHKHSQIPLFTIIKESISPNQIINIQLKTLKKSTETGDIEAIFTTMKYLEE